MRQRILRTFDMTDSPRWDFRGYKPDIVVIKLGTNDCSTGITPSEAAFGKAFRELYGALREHYGSVPILYVIPDGAPAFIFSLFRPAAEIRMPLFCSAVPKCRRSRYPGSASVLLQARLQSMNTAVCPPTLPS